MKLFKKLAAGLSTTRQFQGAPGARAYAVGDVHGRLDLLDDLLDQIRQDIAQRPVVPTYLIFLGDLIDRGPDSAGVIERLRTLNDVSAKKGFLLGNHEEVFLRVLAGEERIAYDWLRFGGRPCLASYGLDPLALEPLTEQEIAAALKAVVPQAHIDFLQGFGDTFRFGDYLFVHAGIRPGIPIEEQHEHDLRWIRNEFLHDSKDHGLIVVHGHTISDTVEERSNRIGIDTGAYQSGKLSAIAVEDEQRWFLSTGG